MIPYADWIAGALELAALYIIGNKNRWGFVLGMLCCVTWVYVGVNREVYGLLIVVIPAFFINIRNFVKWRRRDT